jgi:hypothetical protein
MNVTKPVLVLQLRPEDDTSNSEFEAILKYGELAEENTRRLRIEKSGIPGLSLDDYSAVIVGGSPFDISTAQDQKSEIQVKTSPGTSLSSAPVPDAACWVHTWRHRFRKNTANRSVVP